MDVETKKISDARDFIELYSIIRDLGKIKGSQQIYFSESLIALIEEVREGKRKINYITRNEGLRTKVKELLKNDGKKEGSLFNLLMNKNDFWIGYPRLEVPLSGWKIHIYGENANDSFEIYNILKDYLNKNKIGFKLATKYFFDRISPNHIQFGKAMVIYLPIFLFFKKQSHGDFEQIADYAKVFEHIKLLLEKNNYSKKGDIRGDRRYYRYVFYRYELKIPITPEGFKRQEYKKNYRPNDGWDYNIEGNPDIFRYA